MANKPVQLPEAMIADLRPANGVRFVLLRGAATMEQASYTGAILAPAAVWQFSLELVAGAAAPPIVEPLSESAPSAAIAAAAAGDDLDMLTMIAKLAARAAPTRVASGLAPWPPRIVRWRGPGRGA